LHDIYVAISCIYLEKHFKETFVKLGEIGTAIATVKLYLAQDLGIIEFLAETAIIVLDKASSKDNTI